jgi:hypothetical protein
VTAAGSDRSDAGARLLSHCGRPEGKSRAAVCSLLLDQIRSRFSRIPGPLRRFLPLSASSPAPVAGIVLALLLGVVAVVPSVAIAISVTVFGFTDIVGDHAGDVTFAELQQLTGAPQAAPRRDGDS